MVDKQHEPETKMQQVEVLVGQRVTCVDAIREVRICEIRAEGCFSSRFEWEREISTLFRYVLFLQILRSILPRRKFVGFRWLGY